MLRRTLPLIATLALLAGCGDNGLHYDLKTPPAAPGAIPLAPKGQKLVDTRPTARDAERVKPIIMAWTKAVREGDPFTAATHFDLPTIVSSPQEPSLQLNTAGTAAAYSSSLACAPRLMKLEPVGRFVIGTFAQEPYPGRPCTEKNTLERIGFVFGDEQHPDRFTELWIAPPSAKDETGPAARPKDALQVAPAQILTLVGLQ